MIINQPSFVSLVIFVLGFIDQRSQEDPIRPMSFMKYETTASSVPS
jgi:hypothetical protein